SQLRVRSACSADSLLEVLPDRLETHDASVGEHLAREQDRVPDVDADVHDGTDRRRPGRLDEAPDPGQLVAPLPFHSLLLLGRSGYSTNLHDRWLMHPRRESTPMCCTYGPPS